MTPASRACCAAVAAACALGACVGTPISADAPKVVRDLPLSPYDTHEECLRLEAGDRVEFAFEATEPVDFNVHYREGSTVVMPLVRERSAGDAGVYASPIAHDYCLAWGAGPAGAVLDYRVRLRPAGA